MNILVIEDDRIIAKLFSSMLRDGSFLLNVDTACTKREVNAKLFMVKYDLILCDIMLGDTTGPSVLREYQNLVSDSPIYLMSCLNDIGAYYSDMVNDGFNMIGWRHKPLFSRDIREIFEMVKK
jgi:response regulator of citrate/malate metabolism